LSQEKASWSFPLNGCIQNDHMIIQCDLKVIMDSELCKIKGGFEIQVAPSDLSEHFGRLLSEEEETT
jgi:speckle-type POZ protein